jgi:hypothetical protein
MVDFKHLNGDIDSFPYPYMTHIHFKGGDTITVEFGPTEVTIKGRKLEELRQALAEQRRRVVAVESPSHEMLKPKDAEFVESIEITGGDDK